MIHVNTIRRLLAAADVARDPYAVTETSLALLSANADDGIARLHYVRSLLALGLGAAARRAAASIPGGAADALLPQMAATAPGIIPWTSRARRFRANAAALLARYPEYEPLLAGWNASADAYELHLAGDGNAFIFAMKPDEHWLLGLADHRGGAHAWTFDKAATPSPAPLAFDGIGYGWLLPHVLEQTANSYLNYSCAVYVIEPDMAALCMLMHVHDMQALFTSPRVRWFLGGDAVERFERALESTLSWSVPGQVITNPLTRDPLASLQDVCERLHAGRQGQLQVLKARVDAYYAEKDAAWWSRRFEEARNGGPPLRVVGLTTRFSTVLCHSMEEMREAALAAGAEMQVAMEPDDHSLEHPLLEMLDALKPDLLFQISRLRHEHPLLPRNLPFLCWDQDNLPSMRTPAATASLGAFTYVAGHGANFGYSHLNWPRQNVIFCHPAGATFRYGASQAGDAARYACDVSYVSNASETPEAMRDRLLVKWRRTSAGAALGRAAEQVLALSREGRTWDFRALWELAGADPSAALTEAMRRELTLDLHALADRCFRHTALAWVSRWCRASGKALRIYGAGWQQHAELGVHAAGPAEQGEEMRRIYQASRINLQLIEPGFIHSRALDGIAAGGFFMTRLTPADGLGSDVVPAVYELACWCRDKQISRREEIETSTEPRVQAAWPVAEKYFRKHDVDWVLMRTLETWAELPPACEAIPHLREVTFATEEEFARLAERYLSDEGLRRSIAAEMRAAVVAEFSYSARWRKFVSAVEAGLGWHAAAGAAPALAGVE